ncbi:hypothetical protein BP5796_13031 [Coleophoma crateriformis]|uniref:2-methylcitrate dehydratase n=1 Tax=Coleophoma crateriformis TaxID=565419 RepID=A0A3D8Q6C8_9HELO|nr:hypothetical protein BP5796_13031 [Coleophoma crateriformis]
MSRQYDGPIVDIARYVFHYEITDEAAWRFARLALMDSIGCAIETLTKSEECRRMLGPIEPIGPSGFRLPGTNYVLDPIRGAFNMGMLIRYLDHSDALAGAEWGHPSVLDNIGAILAVADWLCISSNNNFSARRLGPPLTVKTLLTAIIKAYEIQGCYQMRNAFNEHGLDHVILVKLASTAVVSWLLGLTEEQTMAAISHVWMDGHPSRVYRSGANTIPRKGWAGGDACMRAVHLALLTKAGQVGAPTVLSDAKWGFQARCFGGKEFDLPRPFRTWAIQNIAFKVMPVEGHGISSVEAALIQRERLLRKGLQVSDISKIEVRTTKAADMIINKSGPLHNAADRDHCVQYAIALVLLKGSYPETQDYNDDSPWATSTELATLRDKIVVWPDAQLTEDYLNIEKRSVSAGLTFHLQDGGVLDEVLSEYPPSHVRNPRTETLAREKFVRNMQLKFSDAEIERVVRNVHNDELSIKDLVGLLTREDSVITKL